MPTADASLICLPGEPTFSLHRFHAFVKAQYDRNKLYRDMWIFLILLVPTLVFLNMTNVSRQAYFVGALTWGSIATDELAPLNAREGPTEGPNFGDTDTADKWELWFESVLAPKLFDADNPSTEYPLGWTGMAGNNILVGGVRIRQQRAWRTECPTPIEGVECFESGRGSDYENDNTDNGPLLYYPCDSLMELTYGGIATVSKTFSCDGNSIVIPANASYDYVIDMLKNVIIPSGAADFSSTRFLVVEYITYNLPTDIFIYNTHWVQVSVAGKLIPNGLPKPFQLEQRYGVRAFSIVMFVVVLFLFMHLIWEFVSYAKVNGLFLALRDYLLGFWQLENLAMLIVYIVQLCLVFHMWAIADELPKPIISENGVTTFPQNLAVYAGMYERLSLTRGVTILLVFLRILKFGVLFPPVYVITTAILKASKTIIGVGVLCIAAIVAFAVSGYIVFGARIVGFHNIAAAIDSMSRMLVGDYDMDQLESQGVVLATLFFWAFLIVCYFILLNFITAILSSAVEGIEEAKGESIADILNFQGKLTTMWWAHVSNRRQPSPPPTPAGLQKSSSSGSNDEAKYPPLSLPAYTEAFEEAFAKDRNNFNFNFITFLKECFVYYVRCQPATRALEGVISVVDKLPPISHTQDLKTLKRKYAVDDQVCLFKDKDVTYEEICKDMTTKGAHKKASLTVRQFNILWLAFLTLSRHDIEEQSLAKKIQANVDATWKTAKIVEGGSGSRPNSVSKRQDNSKDAHAKLHHALEQTYRVIQEIEKMD